MARSIGKRVRKRWESLQAAGLRPLQIWVPDTRRPGFAEECRRQSQLVAVADRSDADLLGLMDAILAEGDEPPERGGATS